MNYNVNFTALCIECGCGIVVFGMELLVSVYFGHGIFCCISYIIAYLSRISGDCNCLYTAISVAISEDEKLSLTLRALMSAELYHNASFYASHSHFLSLLTTQRTPKLISRFPQLCHAP